MSDSPTCPNCGQPMKRILYGMPTEDVAKSGVYIIGGCLIGDSSPEWGCECANASSANVVDFQIVVNDITRLDVDVIVNAANSQLLAGGGVCGAIHRAAGLELELYCMMNFPNGTPAGTAVITPGFHTKAKHIVHAVAPRFSETGIKGISTLINAYRSAIYAADEAGAESIAIPSLGTGIYGWKVEDVAYLVVEQGIKATFANLKSLKRVILCCFSDSDAAEYRASAAV